MVVLDGSLSLYQTSPSLALTNSDSQTITVFLPIPNLDRLVTSTIETLAHERISLSSSSLSKDKGINEKDRHKKKQNSPIVLYGINGGLRCSDEVSRMAIRRLHEAVLESLVEASS